MHRSTSNRNLIAEQPGLRILFTGLLVAFVLGYIVKSMLSPARVTAQIEKAASHIHKDVKVTFSSAHVSLSHGILPRFAVIISNVKMESTQVCWGAPVLEIDELRLPVSFWNLLRAKAPIQDIEANTVSLRLREMIKDCGAVDSVPNEQSTSPRPVVTLSPSEQRQKYRNDIRGVYIQNLRIAADKYPKYSTEFSGFVAKVKSFEPKVIEVRARNHLMKDPQVGDFLSHANLFLEYKESPQAVIQAHYFGNWREGHYSIIASYSLDEGNLAVETDLKHIPLAQILGILQKYNLASKELNGRQVWLSTKTQLSGPLKSLRSLPMEIRDLRMEGDLGEIVSERIRVSSLDPFIYEPIHVEVQKLDVEKLLVLLNRPKRTSVLGNLGVFSGRADIVSDRKMRLSGEHKGLEFVFSNKGQRELQTIDNVVGDVLLQENQWIFQVNRVEPREGVFAGTVQVRADRDFKEVDVLAQVDELSLAPAVQKLMTSGGSVGLMTLDGKLKMKEGRVQDLKGLLKMDSMEIEGVDVQKARLALSWRKDEAILNTQMQSMKVKSSSPAAEVLRKVTLPAWWGNDGLHLTAITGQMEFVDAKELSWKNFQGQPSRSARLMTEGAWDGSGRLSGNVNLRDGKLQRRWSIKGIRAAPEFAETLVPSKASRK